jgi:transcriptional regulator with XRE-family HTH domain
VPLTLQLGDSRLPELCKRAKISQAALARQLGVSRQFIYKVKMREKNFTLAQGIHASIILKCDIRHLHHEIWKSAE